MKIVTVLRFLCPLLCATVVEAGRPTLSHSAPYLGHELTLELEHAPPLQAVWLYSSPASALDATAFGLLELDRSGITLVALGQTDATGLFRAQLMLPADGALAEAERHYQAFVVDPSAAAGAVLSEAAHLRLVGPRLYAGSRGLVEGGQTYAGGLAIVSALQREIVATVDLGPPSGSAAAVGDAAPVWSPDLSRGAIMASPTRLVLFDPFFGGVLRTVDLPECSRSLLLDPHGERLFVLEPGAAGAHARVHVFDFESADALQVVDLPQRAAGIWTADANGLAYIAEHQGASQRTWIRRFDLLALASVDAFAVGSGRSRLFEQLELVDAQLFVSTEVSVANQVQAELSRVDLSSSPPTVTVEGFFGRFHLANLTAVRASGLLLWSIRDALFPSSGISAERLWQPSSITNLPMPDAPLYPHDTAADGPSVWALLYFVDGDSAEKLYRLDTSSFGWSELTGLPCFDGGVQVEVLRDAYVDTIAFTVGHCGPVGFQDAQLVLLDPRSLAQQALSIGFVPEALVAAPLP